MDRRDFIRTLGVAGGVAAGVPGLVGGVARAAGADAGPEPAAGLLGLLETVRAVREKYLTPGYGIATPADAAEGERAIAHLLHTGLEFWLEADPERPVFKPYVTPTRKLLGDNPDSIYFFAPIRDDRAYRIRGNVGAATFTSFTIEAGSADGHAARGSISALGDDEMEIADDGSFEIHVGPDRPARGNWLRTAPGASQVTTRHYHESKLPAAASRGVEVPLEIEPLDPAPLEPWSADGAERRLGHVANFVREHAAMSLTPTSEEMAKALGWISLVPNRFNAPGQWRSASGDNAYGNTHAWYNAGDYALAPDEALVIEDRFPECRFANVVLWNRFMQTYDYAHRQVSLNRRQITYEKDGSFRIVVAHRDPGVPNWLDTEGRPSGRLYWRFVFPVEAPRAPKAKVVKLSSLS